MIKHAIKKVVRKAGFDIRRLSPRSSPRIGFLQSLQNFDIDLIMDVGANVGQFALELRSIGYAGKIVSFEPITTSYTELCHTAARDPNWEVYRRCAVGDFDGEIQINIARNSVSSSILPMLKSHSSVAEGSNYIGIENAPIIQEQSGIHEDRYSRIRVASARWCIRNLEAYPGDYVRIIVDTPLCRTAPLDGNNRSAEVGGIYTLDNTARFHGSARWTYAADRRDFLPNGIRQFVS
jgi:FkbM family methyltransferase